VSRKAFLAGSAGIAIMLLFFGWQNHESTALLSAGKRAADLPESDEFKGPLRIKMFSYNAFDENGLHNVVNADLLEIRPRRFMAFHVKSVNEAILRNAHLVFYTHSRKQSDICFCEFEDAMPFSGGGSDAAKNSRIFGRVTRLVLQKVTIEFFRDAQQTMVLAAATGLIEKKKKGAKFFRAALEDVRSNRIIRAREILWDRKRSVFVIPGKYIETNPSGSVTGVSIEIDMDFVVSSIR
jgi:hypothetical protein